MRDITLEDTFFHDFTTRAFATGIPTVLAGTPVLSVLEENNATPITAGVSVSVDRASVVGLNEATIVATGANGYEAGKSYSIYISTGTVDSVSVIGEVVGQFTIAASAAAVDLANGTDGLGAIKAETAFIVADTNETQSDDVPGLIAALNDLSAANVNTEVDNALNTAIPGGPTANSINQRVVAIDDLTQAAGGGDLAAILTDTADMQPRVVAIETDTGTTLDGRIPAALVGGRMDASLDATGFEAAAVDLIWDEVLTGAAHNVVNSAGRRLRQLQEAGGYIGAIWIDTVDGVSGTTDFENGTDTKPSDTIANANTLAASLNIERFEVAPGSSITLAAAQDNQSFAGDGWTLALGGQSIAGTTIRGADISGIGTGVPHEFHDCHFGITTLAGGELKNCGLEDTFTISAATIYHFTDCYHSEAGAASTIDFGSAVGSSEVHIHNWHGNLTILNMGTGDILHFTSSNGNLTMDSSNDGGTRNSAGTFGLTDSSTGMTVNDLGQIYQRIGAPAGANISADLAAVKAETALIVADTGTDGVLIATAAIDSGQYAAGAQDAASFDSNAIAGSQASIETGAAEAGTLSTTQMTSNLAEATDEHYNGRTVIWTSGVLTRQASNITAYLGSTGRLTYTAVTEAPSAADTFVIV